MPRKRKAVEHNIRRRSKRQRPYRYDTLLPDQIRVLILSPGKHDDPLRGTLETVSMLEKPKYKAISYAWGDPIFPQVLCLPRGQIHITESLFGALRRMRSKTEPVRLWADAVCINQNSPDTSEKNHQVGMMAEIYRQAEVVVVWLGEALDTDCVASWTLPIMEAFAKQCVATNPNNGVEEYDDERIDELEAYYPSAIASALTEGHICQCGNILPPVGCLLFDNAMNSLCASIWMRPWFYRLWVLQEASLGSKVTFYYGWHWHSLHGLQDAVLVHIAHMLKADPEGSMYPRPVLTVILRKVQELLITMCESRYTVKGERSLLGLLIQTRTLSVSIPHDRIFAMREIAIVRDVPEFFPDYALDLQELWLRVAIYLISEMDTPGLPKSRITMLALAGVSSDAEGHRVPSWVPDFGNLSTEKNQKHFFYGLEHTYQWAGGRYAIPDMSVSVDRKTLSIRGAAVSRIQQICPSSQHHALEYGHMWSSSDQVPWRQFVEKDLLPWYCTCYSFARRFRTTQELESDFGYLLLHGATMVTQPGPSYDDCCDLFREAFNVEFEVRDAVIDPYECYVDLNAFLAWKTVTSQLDSTRIMASTTGGHLGWIPGSSQPDDLVCVLKGAPFPFVVRERRDGCYTLIGDAYIQGIEYGEAWPEDEAETFMINLK